LKKPSTKFTLEVRTTNSTQRRVKVTHAMNAKDARETMIQTVLKTISEKPDSVFVPGDGKGNAKTICEMTEEILGYIKTGEIPVASDRSPR
jgi:hypothetical protein